MSSTDLIITNESCEGHASCMGTMTFVGSPSEADDEDDDEGRSCDRPSSDLRSEGDACVSAVRGT